MKLTYIRIFFLVLSLLSSQVSVFATSVNQDASATNPLICYANDENIIKWKTDGIYQTQFENYFEIDSSHLTKGEVWVCEEIEMIYNPLTYNFDTNLVGSSSVVIKNSAPVVTSIPVLTGSVSVPYTYDVNAIDADGDVLTYSVSGVPNMNIDDSGVITWVPQFSGIYPIVVSVTDSGFGMTTITQNFQINVTEYSGQELNVNVNANPMAGPIPLNVFFTATASGGTSPYTYQWDFQNDGIVDSTSRTPIFTYSINGTFTARVVVTDSTSNTATSTIIINVTDEDEENEEDETEDTGELFIDSIVLKETEIYSGDVIEALVTLENKGDEDFNDLHLSMSVQELGISNSINEFDLDSHEKKTLLITLDLPTKLTQDNYWIKFTISGDDINVVRYLQFNVKGDIFWKTAKTEVVFQPTSLPSSMLVGKDARLNWFGVWFMILLILLLLGLSAYIVKRMAEDNHKQKEKKGQVDLGFNERFY